ncbi:XkdN-like tail assembly chaperone [Paenibacillus sp. BK033]|uniref:phage tail assembly chaperone n=1 Tax=Paenibacillus sp. BK033 TaxID=2512133 RepID=UPI001048550F|nr:XkdN-like protein [Paenibacillus sp. BK033]TCM93136.1 XkdN-like tail assembly chaperone [Paenibacillus sp. BK033]
MNLQEFLNNHPVDNLTEEIIVSPRFKDADGLPLKFTIKAMTSQEFEEIRKSATEIRKGRKVEFDAQKFNLRAVINHTIVPDFKDAASIQKLGCRTPDEYVQKVLLAGEMSTIVSKIQELSGFDVGMNELIDEAKN